MFVKHAVSRQISHPDVHLHCGDCGFGLGKYKPLQSSIIVDKVDINILPNALRIYQFYRQK